MADGLTKLAERVAEIVDTNDADTVRDICDLLSGGQLDCFQLDLVTDMAIKRIGDLAIEERPSRRADCRAYTIITEM